MADTKEEITYCSPYSSGLVWTAVKQQEFTPLESVQDVLDKMYEHELVQLLEGFFLEQNIWARMFNLHYYARIPVGAHLITEMINKELIEIDDTCPCIISKEEFEIQRSLGLVEYMCKYSLTTKGYMQRLYPTLDTWASSTLAPYYWTFTSIDATNVKWITSVSAT